jgi:hypothetical protein
MNRLLRGGPRFDRAFESNLPHQFQEVIEADLSRAPRRKKGSAKSAAVSIGRQGRSLGPT